MNNFIRSFYFKLSVVFLGVLLIMAITQIALTVRLSSGFIKEVDQSLNVNLAKDMASEIEPLIENGDLKLDRIGERIHYMMVMNPKIEIYLLDGNGKILAYFAEPGKKIQLDSVDLKPIQVFLKHPADLPILGSDPRHVGVRKPFSAARLQNREGYLYIIIGSEQYDYVNALFRENFIIRTIIYGLLISALFASALGLILFAFLTRRIRTLSGVVNQFKNGNYGSRTPNPAQDEIGQLAATFNQMADTIVANIDILKQTDSLRREVIANVSHDLRSPLASIQGYLETIQLKEKTLSEEERKRYLDIILKNTMLLNRLVHELFDLSKLDAKQVEPKMEAFCYPDLVQDVMMKFRDQAEKQKITINMEMESALPMIKGDIGMLERALSNLIDNALHHTPEQGQVTIKLEKIDGALRTSVSDSGQGIAEEDLPYIFERYYRGKKRTKRKSNSTGLGLPIAMKILELHQSTIKVESEIGQGATFYFDLGSSSK